MDGSAVDGSAVDGSAVDGSAAAVVMADARLRWTRFLVALSGMGVAEAEQDGG
jgi:hypothetical protein